MAIIKFEDRIGKRYGNLVVLGITGKNKGTNYFFELICDCGKICNQLGNMVFNGTSKGCGCLRGKNARIHGCTISSSENLDLYKTVASNKRLCKINSIPFQKEWDDFSVFLEDMGPKPPGTFIYRIDKKKGFVRGNIEYKELKKRHD